MSVKTWYISAEEWPYIDGIGERHGSSTFDTARTYFSVSVRTILLLHIAKEK